MSQSLSAVLEYLTYTGPAIVSGGSYTTVKRQILEYASLNISFISDQTFNITVLFSDNGDNFDITNSYTYDPLSSNGSYPTPCLGAWVKIRIENTGASTTSTLRMYVYGSITNSVTTAVFQLGPGTPHVIVDSGDINIANTPHVIVDNILNPTAISGDLSAAKLQSIPFLQLNMMYIFSQALTDFTVDPTNGIKPNFTWEATSTTIPSYRTNDGALSLAGFTTTSSADIGARARFRSISYVPAFSNKTLVATMTCKFYDPGSSIADLFAYTQAGFGLLNDSSTLNWYSGVSLGMGPPQIIFGSTYTKFNIILWVRSIPIIINQKDFNVDDLTGSGPSGMILVPSNYNTYKILYTNNGNTLMKFLVFNPSTGNFINFHNIFVANTSSSSYLSNGAQFIMENVNEYGGPYPAFNDASVSVTHASIDLLTGENIYSQTYPISFYTSKSTGTSETFIAIVRNTETFQSVRTIIPVNLDEITVAVGPIGDIYPDGTNIITIYKNCTYTGSPTYTTLNAYYSTLEYYTGGVFASVIDTGPAIATYLCTDINAFIKKVEGIVLSPGENILITGRMINRNRTCNYALRFNHFFY
jgi:hypothetical protein